MNIQYTIKYSTRSRKVRISVAGGKVIVTAPKRVSVKLIDELINKHEPWIIRAINRDARLVSGIKLEQEVFDHQEFATRITEMVQKIGKQIAKPFNKGPKKITIRKMRSRWGSCSRGGNISINLLLGHLPKELTEYVVVHEICHLVHHNHSKNFWNLVAKNFPDYKIAKKTLHRFGRLLRN